MSDGVLTILKFCLLALLYLFLARGLDRRLGAAGRLRSRGARFPNPRRPARAPAKARKSWRLVVVEPPATSGRVFEVNGELTIGRAAGCGVSIPDDTFVSNVHARVFERDGDVFVEDLGSTNGTHLNGAPLGAATKLRKGDRIQAGQTVLETTR